ncbi:MAG TPA: HesA/MoeB/ThiF family protein [Candidatus Limnocylindrales bacterium]|nr:HesA/MoeB/ThiF family protein [Candidatus Limnocylindrales bacterium]
MNGSRHHRQQILAQVGERGQSRLRRSSALVVGLGGLGSPAALYLAAAGVGRLGLIDDQAVELSNLQRQVLYTEADLGRPKVEAARARLRAIDSELRVEAIAGTLRPDNAAVLAAAYDVLIDGTDAFETKFLLNDVAVLLKRPLVHGAVLQWHGQVLTVRPGDPCLRCLFREPPDPGDVQSCEEAGILGATTGVVGSVQAEEALKLMLGLPGVLAGRLFQHDGLSGETRVIPFPRDEACPVCSARPLIADLGRYTEQVSPRGHLVKPRG